MFGRRKKQVETGNSKRMPIFPEYWFTNMSGNITITSYVRKRFGKWYLIPIITKEEYKQPWHDMSGAVLRHQVEAYKILLFWKFSKTAVEYETGRPICQLLDENQENEIKRMGVML